MEGFRIKHANLEQSENHEKHRTEGFSSSKVLVVRRGDAFRVSLLLTGRPLNTDTDSVMIRILLGRLHVTIPVTTSQTAPSCQWRAHFHPEDVDSSNPSVFLCPPAAAPVGSYRFKLRVVTQSGKKIYACGSFILLCNPWCPQDAVYIPFEDQREEYVLSDSGLLFMGTAKNLVSRPWSFDQFEPGVLEACLNLLQVSPQHTRSRRGDFLKRSSPVYISRVVSAMINSEDDRGVLQGNWTGDYKDGVHPSMWTGSGDILTQWAQSHFKPVKYGQCWVFAAVMCTVLRVLGIPCRVVTNFNSAHDTNGNLVIEEYYSETGKKLSLSKDSIWNFHVWVECWMSRRDLGRGMDGWQVSDPTPQERSRGVFCCGPASVKAIKDQRIDLKFDIPFVYAEVNADVHSVIVRDGKTLSYSKDTERVGCLICTKAIGFPRLHNITGDYKKIRSPNPSISSRSSTGSDDSTYSRGSSKGVLVSLKLDKAPIAGPPIDFTVRVINRQPVAKVMKVNLNAQAKEYNHSPSETFWENQGVIQLAPGEAKLLQYKILPTQYEDVVGDDLVNLAVVLEDQESHERFLTSEEFNILTPQLVMKIADDESVEIHKEQIGTVTFTNVFSHPVSGLLTVAGAGLIRGKLQFRMLQLLPGDRVEQRISFLPTMAGARMLQASLSLTHINCTIRGFRMVSVMHV